MGEISDMMLEGELCACCGSYIDDESTGYPRYCGKECEPKDYKKKRLKEMRGETCLEKLEEPK